MFRTNRFLYSLNSLMVMLLALPILVPEMVTLILYHWAGLKLFVRYLKSKVTLSVFVSASLSFFVETSKVMRGCVMPSGKV